jgi:hypothetical protein
MEMASNEGTLRMRAPEAPTTASLQSIRLAAPSGFYHLALHAVPLGTRRVGGYKFEKSLPDFSASELAISDVLLANRIDAPTEGPAEKREDFIVSVNPFQRFARDAPIFIYFEVYNLAYGADDLTHYTIRITLLPEKEDRRLLRGLRGESEFSLSLEAKRDGDARMSLEHIEIDAREVPHGKYELSVAVRDEVTSFVATRSLAIEIGRD